MKNIKAITPEEFDAKVEAGEDIDPYLDWRKAQRPGLELRTVSLDFPEGMVQAIDRVAIEVKAKPMPDKKTHVIVRVDSSTGQAYEDFEALISKEGTKALQEKWSALTHHLRKHLQIEYTPASSSAGEPVSLRGVGDRTGLPAHRKP